VLGVAYKKDIDDVRESPALDIILLLERLGAVVTFSDPYVRRIQTSTGYLETQDMFSSVAAADCVVVVTDHSAVDYTSVVGRSKLIVDTRNALKGFRSPNIVRL